MPIYVSICTRVQDYRIAAHRSAAYFPPKLYPKRNNNLSIFSIQLRKILPEVPAMAEKRTIIATARFADYETYAAF